MRKIFITICMLAAFISKAQTGAYNEQAAAYIRQYKDLAIEEQKRSGVPAAITLAQGIHETQAGTSELATEANNHFGIKCKKEWQGETFAHTDDAPNECFRKYAKAIDSYKDHSDYLRNTKRYESCFALDVTNYSGWASELKRCGYATNPKYAQKLVRIVEDFHLQDYTYAAMGKAMKPDEELMAEEKPAPVQKKNLEVAGEVVPEEKNTPEVKQEAIVAAPVVEVKAVEPPVEDLTPVYGQTTMRNGLKGFYAHKGDVLLEPAMKYNMRYARILELNDLPDAPLEADMFVYLEKKRSLGVRSTHRVKDGETMMQIAQSEGVQLKQLRTLNQMEFDEEPNTGTVLNLRVMSSTKPQVTAARKKADIPNTYNRTTIEQPKPELVAAKEQPKQEEEESEEPATIPVPVKQVAKEPVREIPTPKASEPVLTASVETTAAPIEKPVEKVVETPVVQPPVKKVEQPVQQPVVKKEVVAPRPRPVATPPRQKTYTIADEIAVGEEVPAKYSPRYIAQNNTTTEEKPLEKPLEKPVETPAVKQEEPAKVEEPQDEFSKLKSQLDKAVYGNGSKATPQPKPATVAETKPVQQVNEVVVPQPAPVTASAGVKYHTVKAGDTAFGIAKQYGMSMKELMDMNNLNFEAIKVGQKLKVK